MSYGQQPAVRFKNAYAIAQHSHQLSSIATAGWGGQDGQAAFGVPLGTAPGQAAKVYGWDNRPGKIPLQCTIPPCSFIEFEKLRSELYSCLGRLYSFPFSLFSIRQTAG